jgi:hypothetical protein
MISLIHTFCNSLQNSLSLPSLLWFHWLSPGYGSHRPRFHSFHIPRPRSLLAGVYLTRLSVATQWLTTMRAPPLPMLLPGATFSDGLQWVSPPTANYRLPTLVWLVFQFSTHSPSTDTQRTLLPTIPLLMRDAGINVDHINVGSCVVIMLFPCDGSLCWLHSPGFQWICHNILQHHKRNKQKRRVNIILWTSLHFNDNAWGSYKTAKNECSNLYIPAHELALVEQTTGWWATLHLWVNHSWKLTKYTAFALYATLKQCNMKGVNKVSLYVKSLK